MRIIITEEQIKDLIDEMGDNSDAIKKKIKYVRGLSDECREYAMNHHSNWLNDIRSGMVTGMSLHPDLQKRIDVKGLPSGFSMGVDKNGYYIHTHRARSKSHLTVDKIPEKDIKFIDSTG